MIDIQTSPDQNEVRNLLSKSREAALSAVQMFNNPLTVFKTEAFIVLMTIAWRCLLHAYYHRKKIKYWELQESEKHYWGLRTCIRKQQCPLDSPTKQNLEFLIGLRNEIEHHYTESINQYSSSRYLACCRNYEKVITELFGNNFSVASNLSIAIQFRDFVPTNSFNDPVGLPSNVARYITDFDDNLSEEDYQHPHFAYRLLFTRKLTSSPGQADLAIEFVDSKSAKAEEITKEFWVQKEVEKTKYLPKSIKELMHAEGYPLFNYHHHTKLWKQMEARDQSKGYGVWVEGKWHWYERWIAVVREHCAENSELYV